MQLLRKGVIALAFTLVVLGAPSAHAATNEETLKMIQTLMAQIQELQKQLNAMRGVAQDLLKDNLREGVTDKDVEKLQKLLGTDPAIYPDGRVTGYFGPLTKQAVMRFQARHGLDITGTVDGETHELLEEYLKEAFGDQIPPGLLRAPGIAKKVELRYSVGCEKKGYGMGPLCKKYKVNVDEDDDHEDDDSDDEHFDVEIDIEDGETTLEFKFDGKRYEITIDGTDEDDLLDEVADELDEDVDDLDDHLVEDIKDALDEAVDDYEGDLEEFDVDVFIDNGTTTVDFEFDGDDYTVTVNSTDLDDILDEVADELGEDVDDLDDDLVEAIENALEDEEDSDDEDYDIDTVEYDDGTVTIEFEYDGDDYEVEIDSTDIDEILDEVADEIGEDLEDLNEDFVDDLEDELEDVLEDADDEEAENDAEDAIEDAEDAIDAAQEAIDASNDDVSEAEDLLDEAQETLEEAQDAFDDEDWEEAEDLADEAKDLAEEAEDAA
jgi:gas vesicle protein